MMLSKWASSSLGEVSERCGKHMAPHPHDLAVHEEVKKTMVHTKLPNSDPWYSESLGKIYALAS